MEIPAVESTVIDGIPKSRSKVSDHRPTLLPVQCGGCDAGSSRSMGIPKGRPKVSDRRPTLIAVQRGGCDAGSMSMGIPKSRSTASDRRRATSAPSRHDGGAAVG